MLHRSGQRPMCIQRAHLQDWRAAGQTRREGRQPPGERRKSLPAVDARRTPRAAREVLPTAWVSTCWRAKLSPINHALMSITPWMPKVMRRLNQRLSVKFVIPSQVVQPEATDNASAVEASKTSCQLGACLAAPRFDGYLLRSHSNNFPLIPYIVSLSMTLPLSQSKANRRALDREFKQAGWLIALLVSNQANRPKVTQIMAGPEERRGRRS